MRIGIDIDDTVLITVNPMIKYANLYCKEVLKTPQIKGDLGKIKERFYLKSLYGWTDEIKFAFFNKYYKNVLEECIPNGDSPQVITKLKEENNEIYFISARLSNIPNCNSYAITESTFQKYHIPYDKIIVHARQKLPFIKENNIDLYIDDSYEIVRELLDNNLKALLMTTVMNKDIIDPDIIRVNNWQDVYDYIKEHYYE